MIISGQVMRDANAAHRRFHEQGHHRRLLEQGAEECAELITEMMKVLRYDESNVAPERVLDEMADALLCFDFLLRFYRVSPAHMEERVRERARALLADIREKSVRTTTTTPTQGETQ